MCLRIRFLIPIPEEHPISVRKIRTANVVVLVQQRVTEQAVGPEYTSQIEIRIEQKQHRIACWPIPHKRIYRLNVDPFRIQFPSDRKPPQFEGRLTECAQAPDHLNRGASSSGESVRDVQPGHQQPTGRPV